VEGSGHSLIYDTVPIFDWADGGKTRTPSVTQPLSRSRFESGTSSILISKLIAVQIAVTGRHVFIGEVHELYHDI
jgi:hypothetical protein